MNQKMFEESEKLLMPMGKIFQANIEILDNLREVQSSLATALFNESVDHITGLSKPAGDAGEFIEAQQQYWKRVGAKCEESIDKSCQVLSKAQTELDEIFEQKTVAENAQTTEAPASNIKPSRKRKVAKPKAVQESKIAAGVAEVVEEKAEKSLKAAADVAKKKPAKTTRAKAAGKPPQKP